VDENGILIKEDIHKGQRKIDWKNIKEITYRPFELNFHLTDNNTETVILTTNGEISVDVKRTIREFADGRQIKIVGG
jgi:HSP20 family molecular chaperone IbpA